MFMSAFYILYFGIEQIQYLFNDYMIFGFENYPQDLRRAYYLNTQLYLLFFLFFTAVGYLIIHAIFARRGPAYASENWTIGRKPRASLYLLLIIGLLATAYLGYQFAAMGGFRSELVKSGSGQIITAISFCANLAFSLVTFHLLRSKRYGMAFVLLAIFGALVLATGSRGRLLWPLVIAFCLTFSYRNVFPTTRVLVVAVFAFLLLSIMDPLRKSLVDPYATFEISEVGAYLTDVITRRTFDGFANFSLIVNIGAIEPDLMRLIFGSRDVFMTTFFPDIYRSGVGFGSTYPGYFYISGGLAGIVVLSAYYGAVLAIINVWFRTLRSAFLVTAYFFGIIWFGAVGGDLVESLDKMVIAMAPGLLLALLHPMASVRAEPLLR
jgi:hypothetical protein